MKYVYELIFLGKTLSIYSTEEKANDAKHYYHNFRLYVSDSINDYVVRKTILE